MGAPEVQKDVKVSGPWLGVRHLQVLMVFLAVMVENAVKVNMSHAIVAMTDESIEDSFTWTSSEKNMILSSFKWGQTVLLIPGGVLATWIGGMPVLIISVCVNCGFCLFLPIAAVNGGWQAVCAIRAIQGVGQGLTFPAVMQIARNWVPPEEQGRLVGFVMSGNHLGTVIQMVISGYIADSWGWQGIFYVNGTAGVIWSIIYLIFGANSPATSKFISSKERIYIQKSLQQVGKEKTQKLKTPWLSILTSIPVWALIMAFIGIEWGYWMLLTEIPTYLNRGLGVDIKSNGLISASPYLARFFMVYPIGYISDLILRKGWLRKITCRKVFHSIGELSPALALIAICLVPPNTAIIVTLLCVGLALGSATYQGFLLVYLDLSPNFSSVILGIVHFIGNIVGLNAPLVTGALLVDDTNPKEWHKIFYLTAGFYFITTVPFLVFGSTDRQSWDNPVDDSGRDCKDEDTQETTETKEHIKV